MISAESTASSLAPRDDRSVGTAERSRHSLSGRLLIPLLVALLTLSALWIRLDGLQGWDGTLTVDETRLALAARGVLQTGLPRLPSGWVYTRGLLATYLTAPSFALLGETDFAARLPAVVAGTLLIPVAYLLGREVAGRLGGLFVAALLMGHPSFVVWSRQAWFYALYLLLLALALLFILRAHRTGSTRDQILAGALVGLTAFSHEVGVFLLAPLGLQAALSLWRQREHRDRWHASILALAIVGLSVAVLWLLVTRLRADSLVGAYGEIDEYLSPSFEWSRIRFYLRTLLDGPGLMLAAALLAIPLAIRQRRAETAILWVALLPTLLHAALLIPRGPQERYGLVLVLTIAVLAAQGVRLLSEPLVAFLAHLRGSLVLSAAWLSAGVLAIMLLAHQDVQRAIERAALSPREGAWLRQARSLGMGPSTVIMTDIPTTVEWYIGGVDYWVVSREYEKYAVRTDELRRDVHTGAIIVRNRAELDRLVTRVLAGQELWVLSSGRSFQWGELVDDDLKAQLERNAAQRINPGDNFRFLLLHLPSGP